MSTYVLQWTNLKKQDPKIKLFSALEQSSKYLQKEKYSAPNKGKYAMVESNKKLPGLQKKQRNMTHNREKNISQLQLT